MKKTSADGTKTYNEGSESKWADWQVPPVICPTCQQRVTRTQASFGSYELGTFHATPECLPYKVEVKAAWK